jgi:hypothetical protein
MQERATLQALLAQVPGVQSGLPANMPGQQMPMEQMPPPGELPFSMNAEQAENMGGLAALAAARGRPGGGFGVAGAQAPVQPAQPLSMKDQGYPDQYQNGVTWRWNPVTKNYQKVRP